MYLNMDEITQGPFNKKHYDKLVAEIGLPELSGEDHLQQVIAALRVFL